MEHPETGAYDRGWKDAYNELGFRESWPRYRLGYRSGLFIRIKDRDQPGTATSLEFMIRARSLRVGQDRTMYMRAFGVTVWRESNILRNQVFEHPLSNPTEYWRSAFPNFRARIIFN